MKVNNINNNKNISAITDPIFVVVFIVFVAVHIGLSYQYKLLEATVVVAFVVVAFVVVLVNVVLCCY